MRHFIRWKHFYIFFYAVVTLLILLPFFRRGVVLTLDMRLGPNIDLANRFFGLRQNVESVIGLPLAFLLWLVNRALPFWVWQKLLFFLVFFLAGASMHQLIPQKGASRYYAGLLYMINPFTYVRFLVGQWALLLFYALTPFALTVLFSFLGKRSWGNAAKLVLITTLTGATFEQGFGLLFFIFLIVLTVRLVTLRGRGTIRDILRYGSMSAILFLLLNTYWLVPLLSAGKTAAQQIGGQDLLGFAPAPTSNLGVMFGVASMHGFWRSGCVYTKDVLPFWWLIFTFILFLSVYGALSYYRNERLGWIVKSLILIGISGFILAVGAGSGMTRPLFEWLFRHVPFFNIFRDSQKFVALLALSYAFLGGLGVQAFQDLLGQERKIAYHFLLIAVLTLSLASPEVYSVTMFGFLGQLGVTDYPKEWYEVNEYLNRDKDDFNVLFLPFHEFMDFSWLPNRDKRLGNPARAFFDKPVIQGDNIEMPGIYTQSQSPISHYVSFLVDKLKDKKITNLGELLSTLNVKYVIMVDEVDFEKYDLIDKQNDLVLELARPGIRLFKNTHATSRVYGVNGVVHIESLDEYLKLSLAQDVMENLYIIGTGGNSNSNGMQEIGFSKESPAKYKISPAEFSHTIFTVPQQVTTEYWEYDGQKSLRNLGFMPAFISRAGGGEIVYTRFYWVYVPGYVVSFLTLLALAWFLIGRRAFGAENV